MRELTLRKTVYEYFRQAYRALASAAPPDVPLDAAVFGADGNCAAFRIEVEQGRIRRAEYRCTTCVTLVALCEHLAEWSVGMPVAEANRTEPGWLLAWHPEIPRERRDRAELAVRALHIAIEGADI